MNKLILLYFLCCSFSLSALEVDKRLKARILELSKSKKTILLNKGSEDGLLKNDQAKFSDENGVFARGELIRVSPSRSAWSFFRIYNEEVIKKEKAVVIKITTPFKVTIDKTRSLGKFSEVKKQDAPEKKSMIKFFNKVQSEHLSTDGIDYSILDESAFVKRDSDVDWTVLDGSEDASFESEVDYTELR